MSRTARAVFVDGEMIGYLPVTNAENVEYGNTNVKLALDDKVSKSGDTMSGNLSIQKSLDSDVFLNVKDTTNNKQLAFGFGTSGKRGIYDYSIDNWIFHMNGTDAYVNNTKVPYNGGTLALRSDVAIINPIRVTQSKNFKSLASGSDVQTPNFTITTSGIYIVTFEVAHCGAEQATNANAYWEALLIKTPEGTFVPPLLNARSVLTIPIGNSWDNMCSSMLMYELFAGDYYAKFVNRTGVTTDGTYDSTIAVQCFCITKY